MNKGGSKTNRCGGSLSERCQHWILFALILPPVPLDQQVHRLLNPIRFLPQLFLSSSPLFRTVGRKKPVASEGFT